MAEATNIIDNRQASGWRIKHPNKFSLLHSEEKSLLWGASTYDGRGRMDEMEEEGRDTPAPLNFLYSHSALIQSATAFTASRVLAHLQQDQAHFL